MTRTKIILLLVLAALFGAFFLFDLDRYFNLEFLKSGQRGSSDGGEV
jgi:heme/copper-type cytochrome/quinol oxidase subunit 1